MVFLDILIKNKEVRKAVVERSFLHKIPFKFICSECKFNYDNFMDAYINSKDGEYFNCTEQQFRMMLEILGIKVRHQVVIDKSIDMKAVSDRLSEKYEIKAGKIKNLSFDEKEGSFTDIE